MKYTANYGFNKPVYTDHADIEDLNNNFDTIDNALTPTINQNTAPPATTTPTSKIQTIFGWLLYLVRAITGQSYWYQTPAVTLAQCSTHINDTCHTPATASKAGTMSSTDKAKLDNATSSYTGSRLMLRDSSGRAQVQSPSSSYDIVNKNYADSAYLRKDTAATLSAQLTAQSNTNYTTKQVRNIVFWTSGATPPSTGNGDIVIKTF